MINVKTYYKPVYAYRQSVSNHTALNDIIDTLIEGKNIVLYKNKEEALKEAEKMLCDDDCCGVIEVNIYEGSNYICLYPIHHEYSLPISIHSYKLLEKIEIK